MRTIGVVTGGRADYGIYLPLLREIVSDPAMELALFVTGTHLSPEFGSTVKMIEADGFKPFRKVEMLLSSDSPEAISKAIGLGTIGFAQAYAQGSPDILVVLGDRFEMYAATLAALPFKIPVAHIHGGEVTEGAIDDALRHSITKLSHLHFVATEEYARRVIAMGEEPWRVIVSGALALDNVKTVKLLNRGELERLLGLPLDPPPLLVTFHPVTLEYEQTEYQVKELLEALRGVGLPVVLTMPNADTRGRAITKMLREFAERQPACRLVDNLGTQAYFSVMAMAAAMVGNSSSGILEAMSFELPVVNVGSRQRGRTRPENVIDVDYKQEEIAAGLTKALKPEFRTHLRDRPNPYGDGCATSRIVARLKEVVLDDNLIRKRFFDGTPATANEQWHD